MDQQLFIQMEQKHGTQMVKELILLETDKNVRTQRTIKKDNFSRWKRSMVSE